MAEIDDFDFEGLGSKLTNTILDSFDDALGMIKFSSVGKSLTTALGGVDMAKALSKPLGDGITKLTKNDPNISKAMKDVQKMLEDGFTKVKFKTGPVEVAKISPQVVKLLADTSGLKLPKIKAVDVPVKYKPSELKQLKAVEVPVIYKPGKLQQLKAVNVDVNYKLTNIPTPKVKAVEVPVKYKLSELPSPKVKSIEIPVKYKADKLEVLKSEPVTVPVEYDYGKFQLPKNQKLEVPVTYKPGKLQQLQPKAIKVPVEYKPSKLEQLKVKAIEVQVNYKANKLPQPKVEEVNIPVNYKPTKLPQPKVVAIEIPIHYKTTELPSPKVKEIKIPVQYQAEEFKLPEIKSIKVPVEYKPKKLVQQEIKPIEVPVTYKPSKLEQLKPIDVLVNYKANKLPQPKAIQVAVDYKPSKLQQPKAINVDVNYKPGKLQQPKSIEVPVVYKQSKLEQLKVKAIDIPVKYKPNELKLPKAPNIVVAVKYLYDKFKLPKTQEVSVKLAPDTTKLMSGLTDVVNKTKSAVNTVFASRSISVNADTTNAEQQIAAAFKETTIPVTAVSQAAQVAQPTSTMDTGPLEKAGNLVREFVILTEEANKKTSITAELYGKIVDLAQKIVASKRMEAGAVDEIMSTLQQKMDVPPIEVGAKVTSVDTSSISDAASKVKPIEISATVSKTKTPSAAATKAPKADYDLTGLASQKKMTTEVTKLLLEQPEKFGMSKKQATFLGDALKNNIKYLEDINGEGDSFVEKLKKMAVKGRETSEEGYKYSKINTEINRLFGTTKILVDGLNVQRREGIKLALSGKDGSKEALHILEDQLEVFEDQARALGYEGKLADYVSKQLANGVSHTKILQSQTYKTLANLQAQLKVSTNLTNATQDYNKAVKQSLADIRIKNQTIALRLTEQETSELAYQMQQKNLMLRTSGLLTVEQKKQIKANGGLTDEQVKQLKHDNQRLKHLREHVEIVEHVAKYQLKINEELEEYSMGWKKVKATAKAILTDPALAKGIIATTGIQTIEKMTHAMHEFKDIGMDAASAVQAQFHAFSIASVLGLSKSVDVTKTLVAQYGNMNALTSEQVNTVGKLAANNGLAGDEATNMVMAMGRMPGMTRESASNSEEMFKNIGKTKGVIPSQIMKEVAKNTANMAIYSKGGAQGFAMAAASAKKMGVELNTVLSAARKSLDFESSLNAQMEASVMLGKELNMDKLRQATLSGDANAIMREQQNLIKEAGGLENMNVLQKEKLAEMMGMSVEDMQKMNDEAQFQNKYFGEQADIMDNILGYGAKYGEAILSGVQQFGPLIASIASLAIQTRTLALAKNQSTVATVKDTTAEVNSAAAKRLSAAAEGQYAALRKAGVPATIAMAEARRLDAAMTTTQTTANNVGYLSKMKNFILDKLVRGELALRIALTRFFVGQKQAEAITEQRSYVLKLRNIIASRMAAASTLLEARTSEKLKLMLVEKTAIENASGLAKLRARAAALLSIAAEKLGIASKAQLIGATSSEIATEQAADTVRKKGIIGKTLSFLWTKLQSVGNFLLIGSNERVVASEGILDAVRKRGLITGGLVYLGQKLRAAGSALYTAMLGTETASETANTLGKQRGVIVDGIQAGWKRVKAALGFGVAAATGAETVSENLSTASKGRGVIATLALNAVNLVRNGILLAGNAVLAIGAGLLNLFGIQALFAGTSGATGSMGISSLSAGLSSLTAAAGAVPVLLAIGVAVLLMTPALYVLGEVVKTLATVIGNVLMKALEMLPVIIKAVADGFVTIFNTLATNWKILIPIALGVTALSFSFGLLSISLLALGAAGYIAGPGLMIVSLLMVSIGLGVKMMGEGIKNASDGVVNLVKNLAEIKPVISNIYTLAKALDTVGDSMSRLAKFGAVALPLLLIAGSMSAQGGKGEQASVAPAPKAETKAVAPAPAGSIAAPTTAPASAATSTSTAPAQQTQQGPSGGDMSALLGKLDQLIAVMQAGGTITMDGQKVATIVQKNIRSIKFNS